MVNNPSLKVLRYIRPKDFTVDIKVYFTADFTVYFILDFTADFTEDFTIDIRVGGGSEAQQTNGSQGQEESPPVPGLMDVCSDFMFTALCPSGEMNKLSNMFLFNNKKVHLDPTKLPRTITTLLTMYVMLC